MEEWTIGFFFFFFRDSHKKRVCRRPALALYQTNEEKPSAVRLLMELCRVLLIDFLAMF